MSDFTIWAEVEPPKGTVYNYPIRPWHDAEYYVTGSSGPPEIGVQTWNRGLIPTMVSKLVCRPDHQAGNRLGEGRTRRLYPLARRLQHRTLSSMPRSDQPPDCPEAFAS